MRRARDVDTERSSPRAARYRVKSIPYFVVLNGGLRQQAGLVDAAQLGSWLAAA